MEHKVIEEVIAGLRSGKMGKLAAAQALQALRDGPAAGTWEPRKHAIKMYMHCLHCLLSRPEDVSPADYARLSVGYTREGLQVWCWRHGLNVLNIHFEGTKLAGSTAAGEPDAENRTTAGWPR